MKGDLSMELSRDAAKEIFMKEAERELKDPNIDKNECLSESEVLENLDELLDRYIVRQIAIAVHYGSVGSKRGSALYTDELQRQLMESIDFAGLLQSGKTEGELINEFAKTFEVGYVVPTKSEVDAMFSAIPQGDTAERTFLGMQAKVANYASGMNTAQEWVIEKNALLKNYLRSDIGGIEYDLSSKSYSDDDRAVLESATKINTSNWKTAKPGKVDSVSKTN